MLCYHDKWPDWGKQQSEQMPGKTTAMTVWTTAMNKRTTAMMQWRDVYSLLTNNQLDNT